jgi:MYXO-CTERM domain-containing protein
MKLRTMLAGLAACSTLAAASNAWAVAIPACTPAAVTPNLTNLTVPANLPGLAYDALAATSNDVHLFATSSGKTEVPITVGPVQDGVLKLTPSALVPGTSYELQYSAFCQYSPYPAQPFDFTVGPEAPLPTSMGTAQGATIKTTNFGTTEYTITAAYSLAPEVKPWLGIYQLTMVLDGRPVATQPVVLGGGDGVQLSAKGWCDATNAATKTHTIQLRGTLPFTPTLDTASVEATFDCPASSVTTLPSDPASPPSGGGTTTSGGTATSGGNGSSDPGGSSGGGCSAAPSRSTSTFAFAGAMALGLAALLRSRRRAK